MTTSHILVSGGGLGGLSCAIALAERGFEVTVLEKAPEFTEIGYGIQMGPNATRILKRYGIWDRVASTVVFPESMVLLDAIDALPWARIDFDAAFNARYQHPYVVAHRRDLLGAWLDVCKKHPTISLHTSKGLVRINDKTTHVEVE